MSATLCKCTDMWAVAFGKNKVSRFSRTESIKATGMFEDARIQWQDYIREHSVGDICRKRDRVMRVLSISLNVFDIIIHYIDMVQKKESSLYQTTTSRFTYAFAVG
jgi:hypothetical protein